VIEENNELFCGPVDIRTGYLPNSYQKHCRFSHVSYTPQATEINCGENEQHISIR